jgi:hypothetical protein
MIGRFAVCWNWSGQPCKEELLRSLVPCQASQINIDTSIGFVQTAWNDTSIAPRRISNCTLVANARFPSKTAALDILEEIVQVYLATGASRQLP